MYVVRGGQSYICHRHERRRSGAAQARTRTAQDYLNFGDNERNNGESFTVLDTVVEGMSVASPVPAFSGTTE